MPSTPLQSASDRCDGVANILHDRIELLERRLERVLRPQQAIGGTGEAPVHAVPVARAAQVAELHRVADKVDAAADRISVLIDRLEV